ncbi:MAG: hypothetical protein MRZ79_21130 [Bacteroidia bacterium]|nr:hypothetical protein [Bacteroidia bacterium]
MNLRTQIQQFLSRYQTTGWLILLMGTGFLIEILLILVVGAVADREIAFKVVDSLALPTNFKDLVYQPWSIITYPFFPVLEGFRFFSFLITGFILWTFGRIHQQLLGDDRTRRMVILAIPLIALLTISTTSIIGFYYDGASKDAALTRTTQTDTKGADSSLVERSLDEQDKDDAQSTEENSEENPKRKGIEVAPKYLAYVSGMMAIVLLMVISCITLVPEYPVQLFLFGNVKIVYIGIILFILELAFAAFATPLAISYAFGGLLGFGFVYSLRRGTDITEIIWNYYTQKPDRGSKTRKMEVKPGGAKQTIGKNRKPSTDKKGKIPEEIIDNILDKISESGYESLSREEKELLYKASTQKEDEKRD